MLRNLSVRLHDNNSPLLNCTWLIVFPLQCLAGRRRSKTHCFKSGHQILFLRSEGREGLYGFASLVRQPNFHGDLIDIFLPRALTALQPITIAPPATNIGPVGGKLEGVRGVHGHIPAIRTSE